MIYILLEFLMFLINLDFAKILFESQFLQALIFQICSIHYINISIMRFHVLRKDSLLHLIQYDLLYQIQSNHHNQYLCFGLLVSCQILRSRQQVNESFINCSYRLYRLFIIMWNRSFFCFWFWVFYFAIKWVLLSY